jgi:hypothetical protein
MKRLWTYLLVLVVLAFSPLQAKASDGEKTLSLGGGYAAASLNDLWVHGGGLRAGAGWWVSDFWILDGNLFYAGAYGDSDLHQLFGADASFRWVIDATQWVPSIGVTAGWLGAYSPVLDGFKTTYGFAGGTVCLEYRSKREKSLQLCADVGYLPFDDDMDMFVLVNIDFQAYLPYFFE